MNLSFSADRWAEVKDTYRRWWAGELDRPLINVTLGGYTPQRPQPDIPRYHFTSFYDLDVPADKIVDWWEYNLEGTRFLGDSFPSVLPYFGPGSVAAYMVDGALKNTPDTGTTWFYPKARRALRDWRFRHDPASAWWHRTLDMYRAAHRRFGGQVLIGMTDLGGNLDVLSTFRPNEELLMDLYDDPESVKLRTAEEHEIWWHCFRELREAGGAENPGYSCWTPIFSEEPYYMLQCDFCYMIGPRMFDEFVKPELAASCRRLKNAFYHLDGIGQLPHLDSLLTIPELKGVQWVPGDGQPDITHWPEVYRKIQRAGKRIQIFQGQAKNGLEGLDVIADQLGTAKGIIMIGGAGREQEDQVRRCLDKYGVPNASA